MCLLITFIYSLVYSDPLPIFKQGYFYYWAYILGTSPLSDLWYFLLLLGCLFTFLMVIFWNHKMFTFWWNPIYLFFVVATHTFGVISKDSLQNPKSWRFTPVFSSKGFSFSSYGPLILLSLFFLLIFINGIRIKHHSFGYGYLVNPVPLLERLFFHTGWSWHSFEKSVDHRCFFSALLIQFHWFLCLFCANTTYHYL